MRLDSPPGFRGAFRTDEAARAVYSEAAGIGRIVPRAVAVASDADDVGLLVRWARDAGLAIVPRGSGSSMSGGAIGEGIILDCSRLRRLDDADSTTRSIRAEVGVLRGELDRRARSVGLRFPVDPSSGEFCTIGGMVATNAAGAHSLRHGPVRPWVLAIDCVFGDGTSGTIRRGDPLPTEIGAVRRFFTSVQPELLDRPDRHRSHAGVLKDSSGYAVAAYAQTQDLVDLLVGSEGTLAVFTAVEVALTPAAGATATMFVAFRDLGRAVEAAIAAREQGAAACELLDRTFLTIAAGGDHGPKLPVPADAEAALLVEVESHDSRDALSQVERLRSLFRQLGASDSVVAAGPERGRDGHEADLWVFRHAASPAIARMDPALRSMQFIEDAAVPPGNLAEYVLGVREVLKRNETAGVIFGHAGDAHVHVNPLVDVSRADWRERVERILFEVTDLVVRLGGTTTGEHGDGRLRTPLLDRIWSAEERELFTMVKHAFDPQCVLNPGVKIPLAGQQPFGAVKYDPGLEALPPAARAALATVERERAYARNRLDLL